jgi:hypothetical protein
MRYSHRCLFSSLHQSPRIASYATDMPFVTDSMTASNSMSLRCSNGSGFLTLFMPLSLYRRAV